MGAVCFAPVELVATRPAFPLESPERSSPLLPLHITSFSDVSWPLAQLLRSEPAHELQESLEVAVGSTRERGLWLEWDVRQESNSLSVDCAGASGLPASRPSIGSGRRENDTTL